MFSRTLLNPFLLPLKEYMKRKNFRCVIVLQCFPSLYSSKIFQEIFDCKESAWYAGAVRDIRRYLDVYKQTPRTDLGVEKMRQSLQEVLYYCVTREKDERQWVPEEEYRYAELLNRGLFFLPKEIEDFAQYRIEEQAGVHALREFFGGYNAVLSLLQRDVSEKRVRGAGERFERKVGLAMMISAELGEWKVSKTAFFAAMCRSDTTLKYYGIRFKSLVTADGTTKKRKEQNRTEKKRKEKME